MFLFAYRCFFNTQIQFKLFIFAFIIYESNFKKKNSEKTKKNYEITIK